VSERTGVNEKTGASAPRSWDETSAAAWDKWFHIIEDGARALSDRMIALAAIGPGARVLDVASGLGGADRGHTSVRDSGGNGAAG
jgi:ubiquinone/menaquinone biosynthesis C-methylase UbiE